MPSWIRQSLGRGRFSDTAAAITDTKLHTVCESAHCPNRGECWSRGTATFMLLGDICTRACGFCAVKTGRPQGLDHDEPTRVVDAALRLGLDYLVLTSVNRDELYDGGASIFAATLNSLYQAKPDMGLEILSPDFRGCQDEAIQTLNASLPESKHWVWGHNVETVPSLYKVVRKGSKYIRSLELLERISRLSNVEAKSSLMLGLGESKDEVLEVLKQLHDVGVSRLSLGQYLRPTKYHLPVDAYLTPDQFTEYGELAKGIGFSWVMSGPMVRSSYHAEDEAVNELPIQINKTK